MSKALTPLMRGRPESRYPIELSVFMNGLQFFTVLSKDEILEAVTNGYLLADDVQKALFVDLRVALETLDALTKQKEDIDNETR